MKKSYKNYLKRVNVLKALFTFILSIGMINAMAQEINVSGTVTDGENGDPIPGVSVRVESTNQGTVTGPEGNFKLSVERGSNLVFSFVGYAEKTIKVTEETQLQVQLQPDLVGLDEVVVVGYGTQKRRDLTGSISSIDEEKLENKPSMNVQDALQGNAAGVRVTANSGSPGGSMTVQIRGVGTVNNSDPLYVVDGFPVDNIDYLNPKDIQSIEVLKGASASAIYGSRAANGVVLVSTKGGTKGDTKVSFDGYYGMQQVGNEPDLLNSQQWLDVINQARNNAGVNDLSLIAPADNPDHTTDWFDEVTRTAAIQDYNVSVSGGSDVSTFHFSGNYFNQEGVIKGSDYERITVRLNSNYDVSEKLKVGNNLSVTNSTRHTINEGDHFNGIVNTAIKLDPITPATDENGDFVSSPYTDVKNPVAQIAHTNDENKNLRLVGNAFAEYELIEGLKIKSQFGMDIGRYDYYDFDPTFYMAPDEQNQVAKVHRNYSRSNNWLWENTVTYNATIANDHDITLLAGVTAQHERSEWISATKEDVPNNEEYLRYFSAANDEEPYLEGNASEWSMFSYLGRFNYNFKDKYLLTASVRRDGSSRFGEENRFGVFPSASAGWRLSEENFMNALSFLSTLKLRAGWGQIGNQRIPMYQYTSTVSTGQNMHYVFSSDQGNANSYRVFGAATQGIGNTAIKWEVVESSNIGFDYGLFDGRIYGSFEYYVKNTKDMLVEEPIPDYTGMSDIPFTNAGEVRNKGIEFSLNHKRIEGDFTYDVGVNFSTVNNEVLDLGAGDKPIISSGFRNGALARTEEGGEIGAFYGYETDGLLQNDADVAEYTEGMDNPAGIAPGDVRFVDQNGDGEVNDEDKVFIGSPIPDFTYGINLTASYKNFDMNMAVQGTYGNEIYNSNLYYTMNPGQIFNKRTDILNYWDGEGTSNEVPRLTVNDPNDNMRISDRYIEDGSYLRISNMQIGYTVPKEFSRQYGIQKFRIYVGARNLLTLTDYSGLDPEIGRRYENSYLDTGVDRGNFPKSRVFMAGLNLQF